MLEISPTIKLSLIQEPVIEKRFMKCIKILEKGSEFLRNELISKGLIPQEDEVINLYGNNPVINNVPNYHHPDNFIGGTWQQMATMM